MVNLLQHPPGAGYLGRRKMLSVLHLLFFSAIARDILSAAEVNENPEQSQTISNYFNREISEDIASLKSDSENSSVYKNIKSVSDLDRTSRYVPHRKMEDSIAPRIIPENSSKLESIQKSPIQPKSMFNFPYYRPGRSKDELKDLNNNENQISENEISLFGIPNDASHTALSSGSSVLKRHDTIIPMVRFGRTNVQKRESNSSSVIPYPRLGRSISQNAKHRSMYVNGKSEEEADDIENDNEKEYSQEVENFEDAGNIDQAKVRESEEYDTIIPYGKPGNEIFQSHNPKLSERKTEEEDLDYLLPQIRYGRSMLLFSPPKTDETAKQKAPHSFVLPYPRPGRSNKYHVKVGNSKTEHLILPYPRPGRSDKNIEKRIYFNKKDNQGYMLPFARIGRSAFDTLYEVEGKDSIYADDERFLGLKVNPLFLKSDEKHLSEKPKDKIESGSVFIIPYPRPGKKSIITINDEKQKSNNAEREIIDYVLPYPRPGKRSARQGLQKLKNSNDGYSSIIPQNFIIPYPRPGRSLDYLLNENDEVNQNDANEVEDLSSATFKKDYLDINEAIENSDYENNNMMNPDDFIEKLNKKSENKLMQLLDKDFHTIVPYPCPGRSSDEYKDASLLHNDDETNSDLSESGSEKFISAMYLSEDNSDNLRFKRSTSVVPYPRLGRSGSVVPYPRLGRSDFVVPYPRIGRSNSVIPYPRFGRSHSVVQFPRLKRSNSVVPYPRLGRSNSVVPYPKNMMSNSVVPFPRFRKSNSVIPYPRLGRSNSVVPHIRPGRSIFDTSYTRSGLQETLIPYPRPGRSNALVPYPRPGRSGAIVPYPRPGRSDAVVPYPRPGRSNAVVPYPRPGISNSIVPYPRPGRSNAIVPYPRPGRSNTIVPYPRPGRSNAIVPYPRPGKSISVIPYPRLGRSATGKSISSKDYNKMGNLLLPNIRPGRSNFKRKYTFVVPYPRPGRSKDTTDQFGYTFMKKGLLKDMAYPRHGQSEKGQGYILSHPRIGRSENGIRSEQDTIDIDTVIPYPRLGRSQKQATPSSDVVNTVHKLNKHMISRVDDSIYLLPYPRPGRDSE